MGEIFALAQQAIGIKVIYKFIREIIFIIIHNNRSEGKIV